MDNYGGEYFRYACQGDSQKRSDLSCALNSEGFAMGRCRTLKDKRMQWPRDRKEHGLEKSVRVQAGKN